MSGVFLIVWDPEARDASPVLRTTSGGYPHITLVYTGGAVDAPLLHVFASSLVKHLVLDTVTLTHAFLRAKDGYDDQIRKRCAMSGLVAFRITRDLVTSGAPRRAEVEVAIDLHCAKIFVVREPSPNGKRVVHGSHFDPSRPAMAALVRRLFPEAADLR